MATRYADPLSDELLEMNRQRLVQELRHELRVFEQRYEIGSDQVEAELAAGRLRDTAEICDWVIAARIYRTLMNGRQA